jgi:NaMN:DMB phosphoribosyltransferase
MKNLIGLVGIAVAMTVSFLIVTTATSSPPRVWFQLGGALIVVIAGIVAAVRGSRLWLLLSGLGIGLAAFLVFAVVGP